jgi:hypothetical protein
MPVTLIDEDNLANLEIPRYFKAVYIPDDRFMLVGGLERLTPQSSARCFSIDERARVNRLQDMEYGRQYFTVCFDQQYADDPKSQQVKKYLYVISGYNHEYGKLNEVERFTFERQQWETVEPVNLARVNASACKCGDKYIYLFGGLDIQKNEFTDCIERYNQELSIWTILTLKLPNKISNCFAFSINPEMILIMGGVIKKEGGVGFGGS